MTTYTATVTRDGKWWMIHVPDIDGLTQARRLGEVEEMARSLIAVTLDVPADSFGLRVELEAVEDIRVTAVIDEIHAARQKADELAALASVKTRDLAQQLAAKHIPMRDIGTVLGVTHQRAAQLISDGKKSNNIGQARKHSTGAAIAAKSGRGGAIDAKAAPRKKMR